MTSEAKVLDKLGLLERVVAHGKCLVGAATLDVDGDRSKTAWTYASWDPIDPDEDPDTSAPSLARKITATPGSADWMEAARAAVQDGCARGGVTVVLPPGLVERDRMGLVAELRSYATCELQTAVLDRPATRPAPAPSPAEAAYVDAHRRYAARQYSEAAALLEKVARGTGATDPRLLWNIGRSLALAGQCEAAEVAFRRFRAVSPDVLGRALPGFEQ